VARSVFSSMMPPITRVKGMAPQATELEWQDRGDVQWCIKFSVHRDILMMPPIKKMKGMTRHVTGHEGQDQGEMQSLDQSRIKFSVTGIP
jgi:hypothetical protein